MIDNVYLREREREMIPKWTVYRNWHISRGATPIHLDYHLAGYLISASSIFMRSYILGPSFHSYQLLARFGYSCMSIDLLDIIKWKKLDFVIYIA